MGSLLKNRDDPPFKVESGFGGCCIYPIDSIIDKKIKYDGLHCEHVSFHLSMTRIGKNNHYVNPAFILLHTLSINKKTKNLIERIFL